MHQYVQLFGHVLKSFMHLADDIPPEEVPDISDIAADEEIERKWRHRIHKYAKWEIPGVNCTPPGIDDFPDDLFTQAERRSGFVVIHFLVSLYIFVGFVIIIFSILW